MKLSAQVVRGILVDSAGKPTSHPLEPHLTLHARLCVGACAVDRRGNVQWLSTSTPMDKQVRLQRECVAVFEIESSDVRNDCLGRGAGHEYARHQCFVISSKSQCTTLTLQLPTLSHRPGSTHRKKSLKPSSSVAAVNTSRSPQLV